MSKFADYTPNARSAPLSSESLAVRTARTEDIQEVARIAAEREGDPIDKWLPLIERARERASQGLGLVLVASVGGVIIGYGKVNYFSPPENSPENIAPEGWYLSGVVVHPDYRRHGIGAMLTRERLSWIAQRSNRAFYFANARNLVTIDLHKAFGFTELTRDFHYPNNSFEGGVGILFVCEPIAGE